MSSHHLYQTEMSESRLQLKKNVAYVRGTFLIKTRCLHHTHVVMEHEGRLDEVERSQIRYAFILI